MQRVAIDREHNSKADPRAKTVKLADVIDNVGDIAVSDPDFARKYIPEKELLLQVLSDGHQTLYKQATQVIADARTQVFG